MDRRRRPAQLFFPGREVKVDKEEEIVDDKPKVTEKSAMEKDGFSSFPAVHYKAEEYDSSSPHDSLESAKNSFHSEDDTTRADEGLLNNYETSDVVDQVDKVERRKVSVFGTTLTEDTRPIEENEEDVEPEDASNASQEEVDAMLEDEGVFAFLVRDPNNPANSFLVPATSVKDYH